VTTLSTIAFRARPVDNACCRSCGMLASTTAVSPSSSQIRPITGRWSTSAIWRPSSRLPDDDLWLVERDRDIAAEARVPGVEPGDDRGLPQAAAAGRESVGPIQRGRGHPRRRRRRGWRRWSLLDSFLGVSTWGHRRRGGPGVRGCRCGSSRARRSRPCSPRGCRRRRVRHQPSCRRPPSHRPCRATA
jgi:hypothetical protein